MKILWVEDSEDDVFLLTRALYRSHPMVEFHHVWNGGEAMDYLLGKGEYANRIEFSLPDVVVTDLRMPAITGFQFIQWLRQHPLFKSLPVLVLTSSGLAADLNCALALGATDYLVKPQRELAWEAVFASVLTRCKRFVTPAV